MNSVTVDLPSKNYFLDKYGSRRRFRQNNRKLCGANIGVTSITSQVSRPTMENFTSTFVRLAYQSSLLYLLLSTSISSAFPTSINLRSSPSSTNDGSYLAVGILCDSMMNSGDTNGDGRLSSVEIENFYRRSLRYPAYIARIYGEEFVRIADTAPRDGLLNRSELLRMLIALDASSTTRR